MIELLLWSGNGEEDRYMGDYFFKRFFKIGLAFYHYRF